jgi:hypothetical protein
MTHTHLGRAGLIDLVVPIVRQPGFDASYLLETGWGVLFLLFVGAPLIAVACAPNLVAPVVQVALVALAGALVAFLVPEWLQLLPAAALLLTSAVLVWLSGGRWQRAALTSVRSASVHRGTLILAGAAAIPLAVYAADLVAGRREGRPPTDDITLGLDHWPMQAALAVAIVLTVPCVDDDLRLACLRLDSHPGRRSQGPPGWVGSRSDTPLTQAASVSSVAGLPSPGLACWRHRQSREPAALEHTRAVQDPTFIDDDAPKAGSWHRSPRSRPSRTHGPMAVDAPSPSTGGGRELSTRVAQARSAALMTTTTPRRLREACVSTPLGGGLSLRLAVVRRLKEHARQLDR